MKPIQTLSGTWSALPKERKTALVTLALLMMMLGSLVGYERFALGRRPAVGTGVAGAARPEPGAQAGAGAGGAAAGPEAQPAAAMAAGDLTGKMMRPLAGAHRVLKSYGNMDESLGAMQLYGGVAYQAQSGESVQAAAGGTVVDVSDADPLDGVVVTVDHGGGVITRYAGLGAVLVKKSAQVKAGDLIGQVGQPGPARSSMGSHIEFQVIRNGQYEDPATYLAGE